MGRKKVFLLLVSLVVFMNLFINFVSAQSDDSGLGTVAETIHDLFGHIPEIVTFDKLSSGNDVAMFWAKFLLWILLFAVVYYGATKVPALKEKNRIATVVALTISLISILMMPNSIIVSIFKTYGLVAGILVWIIPVAAGMFLATKIKQRWLKVIILLITLIVLLNIDQAISSEFGQNWINDGIWYQFFRLLLAVVIIAFIWNLIMAIGGEGGGGGGEGHRDWGGPSRSRSYDFDDEGVKRRKKEKEDVEEEIEKLKDALKKSTEEEKVKQRLDVEKNQAANLSEQMAKEMLEVEKILEEAKKHKDVNKANEAINRLKDIATKIPELDKHYKNIMEMENIDLNKNKKVLQDINEAKEKAMDEYKRLEEDHKKLDDDLKKIGEEIKQDTSNKKLAEKWQEITKEREDVTEEAKKAAEELKKIEKARKEAEEIENGTKKEEHDIKKVIKKAREEGGEVYRTIAKCIKILGEAIKDHFGKTEFDSKKYEETTNELLELAKELHKNAIEAKKVGGKEINSNKLPLTGNTQRQNLIKAIHNSLARAISTKEKGRYNDYRQHVIRKNAMAAVDEMNQKETTAGFTPPNLVKIKK